MRLQLALNVTDLDKAVSYYSRLFDTEPHKRRPGYANFAIDKPPLKLVLFENPAASERLNHLGVEVFNEPELDQAVDRLQANDLAESSRTTESCCYSEQDKIWSIGPDGERWELYRIVNDQSSTPANACC